MRDTDTAGQHLGSQLIRRRIELDPAYRNRRVFTDERGLDYRVVSDIETGRRSNFEGGTITALEVAYSIAPGSIRAAMAGSELRPISAPEGASERGNPDSELEALVPLLIEVVDKPTLREALRATWALEDDGRPRRDRTGLLRHILEGELAHRTRAQDGRRNGTTD